LAFVERRVEMKTSPPPNRAWPRSRAVVALFFCFLIALGAGSLAAALAQQADNGGGGGAQAPLALAAALGVVHLPDPRDAEPVALALDDLGPRVRVDYSPDGDGEGSREWLLGLLSDLDDDGLVDVSESDGEVTTSLRR
jgi:hypothetical protein